MSASSIPPVEELVQAELDLESPPRQGGEAWLKHPPFDLYGLALSGGGIRSATFNLGLLQALDRLKLLPAFHYVSTVSGGGYLGGFWTRWRHGRDGRGDPRVFPTRSDGDTGSEAPEIRHLREYSNFLAPRPGVFSYDTGRLLVTALASMLPSLLTVLALLVLGLAAWLSLAFGLFSPGAATRLLGAPISTLTLALGTLAVGVAFEWAWRRRLEQNSPVVYALALGTGVLLSAVCWTLLTRAWTGGAAYREGQHWPVLVSWGGQRATLWDWGYLLVPCAAWLGAALTLVAGRTLASRAMTTLARRGLRGALDRVVARLLFLVAAWAVLTVLWCSGVLLHGWIRGGSEFIRTSGVTGAVLALTGLAASIQRVLGREPNRPVAGRLARFKAVLPQAASYAAIGLMVSGTAALLVGVAGGSGGAVDPVGAGYLVAGSALVMLVALLFFDPNEVGLHGFYRARLARAFCGAGNPDVAHRRRTEECEGDDVMLSELDLTPRRPVPLICCAANDLASDGIANLYRGARSAVLSRTGFAVGEWWARWPQGYASPLLSSAMTASGSAFNSLMGAHSVRLGPGVTFLLAAFNLRLGLWWTHPRVLREQQARTSARGVEPQGAPRARGLWIGASYFRELFSLARADGSEVHLSDGGHFENLAVYELVRRHCRVIVASDCGQDGDSAFDDVGNLVRKVRQDFGVEIRIDLSPLRPGPDGRARQHMVAGDIHYPDGDTGVLLLFKPALVGSEPADVAQYRARNANFPHQSTLDQFYDEAQWEAYRRLGEHAGLTAFRPVVGDGATGDAAEVFAIARREWLTAPEGAAERLTRFAEETAALDAALREPGCGVLLDEVYPELRLLDQQVGKVQVSGIFPAAARRDAEEDPAQAPAADPVLTLHTVRRALGFLLEVYERERLDRNHGHPLYLGMINYFGRWTAAPYVRFWWPVLKPLYPAPFARFVETRLGVGTQPAAAEIRPAEEGMASRRWALEQDAPLRGDGDGLLEYVLKLRCRGSPVTLQAALLAGTRHGDAADGNTVLAWDAPDLFIPCGLWGTGLGQDFLRMLRAGQWPRPTDLLAVCIHSDPRAPASQRKAAADTMQLYRSVGFVEAHLAPGAEQLYAGADRWPLPGSLRSRAGGAARWMVSPVSAGGPGVGRGPAAREEAAV